MGAMTTPCRESPIRGGNGYGKHRNQQGLHRWVMEQVHGADAIRGRSVMHLCDNPACFRFDHLAIGSHADNMNDMVAKGRNRNGKERDHCPHGHEYTPENTYERPDRPGQRECRECRRAASARCSRRSV